MQSNNFYSYDDGAYHYIYHYEYDTPVGNAILRYRYLQYFSLFEDDNTNEYISFP